MVDSLIHRGPDGRGTWLHDDKTMGLGHTRLAVIDPEGGQQPMVSSDGRHVLVFNGEIYNYRELAQELQGTGHRLATKSDTEVLLTAYRQWGRACLQRLRGMFAFAVLDTVTRELFLARDRTGIKPLYYYRGADGFFFGSELKAILSVEHIPRRVDYEALYDYLVFGYPLLPRTFYQELFELEPGTWLHISWKGMVGERYWNWKRGSLQTDGSSCLEKVKKALVDSLRDHLIADVPIGALLSGGIDSSLLVAMIVKSIGTKLDTFTVKFHESSYDESRYAAMVARELGTNHQEILIPSGAGDVSLMDEIVSRFDQPFGDSSAIPVFLICREMSRRLKVVISGDGGDELFGGYRRFWLADLARKVGKLHPLPIWLAKVCSSNRIGSLAPGPARKVRRFLKAAAEHDETRLSSLRCFIFADQIDEIVEPWVIQKLAQYSPTFSPDGERVDDPGGGELIDATIRFELPGDYLRKVDMMSSAHGLEVRVPLLGQQVLDVAAMVPARMNYSWRCNKILLRKLAADYLPHDIVRKPKRGFTIPLDSWLGEHGRKTVRSILGSRNASIAGLFRPEYLEPLLSAFVEQKWDRARWSRYKINQMVYLLWSLERWLAHWNPQR